jgi:hypothetical protein
MRVAAELGELALGRGKDRLGRTTQSRTTSAASRHVAQTATANFGDAPAVVRKPWPADYSIRKSCCTMYLKKLLVGRQIP